MIILSCLLCKLNYLVETESERKRGGGEGGEGQGELSSRLDCLDTVQCVAVCYSVLQCMQSHL